MARKTRVSFIKGMMVIVVAKGMRSESRQFTGVFDAAGFTGIGLKALTIRAKHPPRTVSHKPAKKAVTHGFLLNTARVRKKKRRDVKTRVAPDKVTPSLLSMTHIEFEGAAEENQRLVSMRKAFKNLNSHSTRTTAEDIVNAKQHNL
jgi:hypothetical protein